MAWCFNEKRKLDAHSSRGCRREKKKRERGARRTTQIKKRHGKINKGYVSARKSSGPRKKQGVLRKELGRKFWAGAFSKHPAFHKRGTGGGRGDGGGGEGVGKTKYRGKLVILNQSRGGGRKGS